MCVCVCVVSFFVFSVLKFRYTPSFESDSWSFPSRLAPEHTSPMWTWMIRLAK